MDDKAIEIFKNIESSMKNIDEYFKNMDERKAKNRETMLTALFLFGACLVGASLGFGIPEFFGRLL